LTFPFARRLLSGVVFEEPAPQRRGPGLWPLEASRRRSTDLQPIGTAKLNGRAPKTCLRQVIGCIAEHPVNHVAELLPWNLAIASAADNNSYLIPSIYKIKAVARQCLVEDYD
jgi:hypothetical protein